jgi:hypothetical protein
VIELTTTDKLVAGIQGCLASATAVLVDDVMRLPPTVLSVLADLVAAMRRAASTGSGVVGTGDTETTIAMVPLLTLAVHGPALQPLPAILRANVRPAAFFALDRRALSEIMLLTCGFYSATRLAPLITAAVAACTRSQDDTAMMSGAQTVVA